MPSAGILSRMLPPVVGALAQPNPLGALRPLVPKNNSINAPYGLREDRTPKGVGFFGELRRPDGDMSTELSFDFDQDGKKVFAPLLVPTLSRQEIDLLLSGAKPTPDIFNKASQHAMERLRLGKPAFALPDELYPVPK